MAHRKPLGTMCRLPNFHWHGGDQLPMIGEWLVSTAGTVYLIIGTEECARPDRINLVCERRGDVEDNGHRVIDFYWHSRDRRS